MTNTDIEGPALVRPDHIQDRGISKEIGAEKAYRRVDGLAMLSHQNAIARHQYEAGRRLQEDYALSQMEGGARSDGTKVNGGRRDFDIPQYAIDARDRLKAATAVLPPELLTMTTLFLFPDHKDEAPTFENIAVRVKEHKRCISFGVRAALSLLARHYVSYRLER